MHFFSCAYETERAGYTHFAIKEKVDNIIACYMIDSNSNAGRTTIDKKSEVLNDLNKLLSQRRCPEKCDDVSCVRLGSGEYAAVYEVTRKRIFYHLIYQKSPYMMAEL